MSTRLLHHGMSGRKYSHIDKITQLCKDNISVMVQCKGVFHVHEAFQMWPQV